jgi:hypothetical protein
MRQDPDAEGFPWLHLIPDEGAGQISGKSTPTKAIRYSLSRWTRYTTDSGEVLQAQRALEQLRGMVAK